jgi:hypothetical protein
MYRILCLVTKGDTVRLNLFYTFSPGGVVGFPLAGHYRNFRHLGPDSDKAISKDGGRHVGLHISRQS